MDGLKAAVVDLAGNQEAMDLAQMVGLKVDGSLEEADLHGHRLLEVTDLLLDGLKAVVEVPGHPAVVVAVGPKVAGN